MVWLAASFCQTQIHILPGIQTVTLTQKNIHMHCMHINLPHSYMPTVVCFGRVSEPVAMIETCPFKLEAWDMALSAALHSHTSLTTPILINHIRTTNTALPSNTPNHLTSSWQSAREPILWFIQSSFVLTLFLHLPFSPVLFTQHTILDPAAY